MESKSGKKEMGLSVSSNVPDMLSVLDEKIKSIKKLTDTVFKTTGNLENFGDIKTEMKVENLIRAFSKVMAMSEHYSKAMAALEVTSAPEFSISGGTVEDWKYDIKLRIAIVEQDTTLKNLEAVKKEMSELLDKEDRKAIVLSKLEDLLGK